MPWRNGTGPTGAGPLTGRGLGSCTGSGALKCGAGLGLGLGLGLALKHGLRGGFGHGLFADRAFSKPQKEALLMRKTRLQKQLDAIDQQLEAL